MVPSFLIFFRESLEASMICSIMLAYLKQIDRRDRFKDVWFGIGAAVAVAIIGGIVVFTTLRSYDGSRLQTMIEGITYFIACGVLTYMTFWMKKQGRNLKKELHAKIETAVGTGSVFAIALIAFITVGREGLETVVFMIAIAFHTNPFMLGVGALVGVAVGLILSYAIYVLGKRINLQHFFNIMGTLLMLFAAGLLADGIENFQQLGWFPNGRVIWNTASILNEDSTFGDVLHSFFGYASSPTALQVVVYALFLVVMVGLFWRIGRPQRQQQVPTH
ncbi:FTR1 family protein [Alicyclobacillus sp. SO9]|uniref:FTR1 family iron permease n=1 Tax=Alicyclobacillus sp. SO9 TaxID=2665646 RepID=UPI0018E86BB3|nr:FTR1 family protein [Alicyclobacillus sp. SO9]QQE77245.1 FTR1 family protein [Alicyclobacillus sp. SO9]